MPGLILVILGGPLLNTRGEVIGMNTAITGTDKLSGIGFAIPSNTITKIVPILIEKGYYPHPYLGLVFASLTSDLAQDNDIPLNVVGKLLKVIRGLVFRPRVVFNLHTT